MKLLIPTILLLLMTVTTTAQRVQQIFVNGTIHTLDPNDRVVEAMAVTSGRIMAAGPAKAILAAYKTDTVIDLGGRHVYPGFTDAHCHLRGLGEESLMLDLRGCTSKKEALERLADYVRSHPGVSWIRGRGWDQNLWKGRAFPTRQDIDAVIAKKPVFLTRIDGHAAWVNTAALAVARIDATSPDPEGGRILRDKKGAATGVLLDMAVDLVKNLIPPISRDDEIEAYASAVRICLAAGITGVHDMGLRSGDVTVIRSMIADDSFPFRLLGYIDGDGPDWEQQLLRGRTTWGRDQLVVAGLKLYADGALGSRGALLGAPYADDPRNRGLLITRPDHIARQAELAMKADMQVCVHAIGDSAVGLVLDAYEKAVTKTKTKDHRLRIEHCQVLRAQDIPRFAALGVIPSMQPTHCTSDMRWAEARLGPDRVRRAYAWRSLLDAGSFIPCGSDFPIERPGPLAGILAASTRRDAHGAPASQADITAQFQTADTTATDVPERYTNGWYGSQRMTRREALLGFTLWAARAGRMETAVGSLEVGKYADFILLPNDILTCPDSVLATMSVQATYIAGREVWAKERD